MPPLPPPPPPGDSIVDLLFTNFNAGLIQYLPGTGAAGSAFGPTPVTVDSALSLPGTLMTGDIDGNGALDLAVLNGGSPYLFWCVSWVGPWCVRVHGCVHGQVWVCALAGAHLACPARCSPRRFLRSPQCFTPPPPEQPPPHHLMPYSAHTWGVRVRCGFLTDPSPTPLPTPHPPPKPTPNTHTPRHRYPGHGGTLGTRRRVPVTNLQPGLAAMAALQGDQRLDFVVASDARSLWLNNL
jgi:hypothetical protein